LTHLLSAQNDIFSATFCLEIGSKAAKVRKDTTDGELSSSVLKSIQDLKHVIDQQRIAEPTNVKATREFEDDPLKRFFTDEINTTIRLLQFVRSDLDILQLKDDLKVGIIITEILTRYARI
jgi:hypothetical protein